MKKAIIDLDEMKASLRLINHKVASNLWCLYFLSEITSQMHIGFGYCC